MHRTFIVWSMLSVASAMAADKSPAVGYAGNIAITPIIHSSVRLEFAGRVIQVDPRSVGDLSRATPADQVEQNINALAARCPGADDLKAIDHDLKLVFESDPTRGSTHECTGANGKDLSLLQSRVYRALATMRALEFSEPLPWTKDSAYRWLTKSVRGVRFTANARTSFCCGPDGLINVRSVIETSPDGRQSGLALAVTQPTQMPTDFRLLAGFLQLLVHEARHHNGKPHTCGTKDKTIGELGAWGAAYSFQKWLVEKTAPGFVPISVKIDLQRAMESICTNEICIQSCVAQ
jgi:hypothetical protein